MESSSNWSVCYVGNLSLSHRQDLYLQFPYEISEIFPRLPLDNLLSIFPIKKWVKRYVK